MKYIIVKDRNGEEHAILFPNPIIHKDVARIHRVGEVQVVSAGFCNLGHPSNPLHVWGKSESLNGKFPSRPEDKEIIKKDFGDLQTSQS